MIKAFFIDLDGTLLGPLHSFQIVIPRYNLIALKKLVKNNIKVIIASGRDLKHTVVDINEAHGFDFDAIASNGLEIYCEKKIREPQKLYDKNKLKELTHFLQDKQEVALFLINKSHQSYYVDKHAVNYEKLKELASDWRAPDMKEQDISEFLDSEEYENPHKVCVFTRGDPVLSEWIEILKRRFSVDFEIFNTDNRIIELMPPGVNKGQGMRKICEYYQYEFSEVAAIGDSGNDIAMLQLTPHSYAVSSAEDKVKAVVSKEVDSVAAAVADILQYNKNFYSKAQKSETDR